LHARSTLQVIMFHAPFPDQTTFFSRGGHPLRNPEPLNYQKRKTWTTKAVIPIPRTTRIFITLLFRTDKSTSCQAVILNFHVSRVVLRGVDRTTRT